jgi:hypothetical protein
MRLAPIFSPKARSFCSEKTRSLVVTLLPFGAKRLEGEVPVAALAMRRAEGIKINYSVPAVFN